MNAVNQLAVARIEVQAQARVTREAVLASVAAPENCERAKESFWRYAVEQWGGRCDDGRLLETILPVQAKRELTKLAQARSRLQAAQARVDREATS